MVSPHARTRLDSEDPHQWLAQLNKAQRAAVLHGEGRIADPLLIIAGAGTGKTNTLVHRLAYLIAQGADPRRIMLVTFSRRAAAEMIDRTRTVATRALGTRASILVEGLVWAGTFHGIGAKLLRDLAPAIGMDAGFTIHDRGDSADLVNLVRHQLGFSKTEERFPAKATCLAIYSRTVNAQCMLAETLKRHFPWCAEWQDELKALFAAYVEAKQAQNVLDYDDLLLAWAAVMAEPGLASEVAARFDHVLVDEYQDTNRLQASILMGLKPDGRGLAVVGDDAQSIYAFRAAEVRNILDFPHAFSPPASIVKLEENYRSSPGILAAANAVIAEACETHDKALWSRNPETPGPFLVRVADEAVQVGYVCEKVLELREDGAMLMDQAVLFRTAHHSGPLEVELTRRNIPFVKFGGLKFLEAAHIKDVLAVLRFAENPKDRIAGFRILQLMPGIGPSTATTILDAITSTVDPAAALQHLGVPSPSRQAWSAFTSMLVALTTAAAGWPADLETVRAWYEPLLETRHADHAIRRHDIVQLGEIARGYGSRAQFLTELTLDPPGATSDLSGVPLLDEDYLTLSTIHSAKGREWRQVFILNCVDGCIPSDLSTGTSAEIDEERRLLYVAMTRAKADLHLIQPLRFFAHNQPRRGDRHVFAARTRFLTDAVMPHIQTRTWPTPPSTNPQTRQGPPPTMPTLDIKARLKAMWG